MISPRTKLARQAEAGLLGDVSAAASSVRGAMRERALLFCIGYIFLVRYKDLVQKQ